MAQSIVFIPALLCDEALYADVIAGLGAGFSAEVMLSPKPDMAASVADILARAPEKFILAGTSYGGALALEVALAAPERVSALWLMGCDGDVPDPAQVLGMAEMLQNNLDGFVEFLGSRMVHESATAARAVFTEMAHRVGAQAGADEARSMTTRTVLWDRVHTLTMPCLVMWGAEDALVPVATGRKLAEGLPHAHFYAIPGSGHLPTLEKPEAVLPIVLDFLEHDHGHHH
jgi:pimeloyl-ACP methyl ester carboxylesterase